MVPPGNAEFLELWERGHRMHPLDRALLVIQASLPMSSEKQSASSIADWPLGRRNRALAQARTLYFGPTLEGWTVCPQCGEKLEFELDCRAIGESPETMSEDCISAQGGSFRPVTSRDLALVAGESDCERAALVLIKNCTLEPSTGGSESEMEVWPPEAVEEIAAKMAEADPLAEISLGFDCPICRHTSQEVLDLGSFLWTEIEARARQLLSEVHALAAAYGWAEAAILGMSDVRRAAYLGMGQRMVHV
jgi:hypothetical protein